MPSTKKESFYFGLMMCFGMVVIMTVYNLIINGLIGKIGAGTVILEFLIGFVIALVLDMYLIGPLAKKIVLRLPFNKSNKAAFVILMSTCMVIGMASCMSIYGLVTSQLGHSSAEGSLAVNYLAILLKNFCLAYPLQLLVMGPLVRGLFMKFVKKGNSLNAVKAA